MSCGKWNLFLHLSHEIESSKFQVMVEFGFELNDIVACLQDHFCIHKSAFKDAATLFVGLTEFLENRDSSQEFATYEEVLQFKFKDQCHITENPTTEKRVETKHVEQHVETKREYKELYDETMKLYAESLCRLCHESKRTKMVLPCAHLCLCKFCRTKHCPICYQRAEGYIHTYS